MTTTQPVCLTGWDHTEGQSILAYWATLYYVSHTTTAKPTHSRMGSYKNEDSENEDHRLALGIFLNYDISVMGTFSRFERTIAQTCRKEIAVFFFLLPGTKDVVL